MATLRGLAGVAAVAALFHCAVAANINVGSPNGGWDLTTDLKTWAASQKFATGDTLVFRYTPTHDVVEVTKADYDACQASNPIRTYTGGNTAIVLPAPGKRYFICSTAGHCSGGMKLEVDVVSAASSAPPTASPATPPPKSAPSPREPKMSPSPSKAPKAPAPSPSSLRNSPAPSPSSNAPGPAASAGPSGSPPDSAPNSPSPSGSSPPGAPSAAGGLKSPAAAGLVCGLLTLLAI